MTESFVHLHVHTEYSMLDGATRLDDLVDAAVADNQPAVAITDHGVLFGLVDFYKAAKDTPVKPILGSELYQSHGSRFDQERTAGWTDPDTGDSEGNSRYYHLTALAQNDTGYHNLVKVSTEAYTEGYWYKPRVDRELLAKHSDGMIVLSGCLGGEVHQVLASQGEDAAKAVMAEMRDIYTPERYFIELMDHGIPAQRRMFPTLQRLATDLGLRTVITNDSHYTTKDEAEAHDIFLCIGTQSKVRDEKRFRFSGPEYYIRSAAEMWQQFGGTAPDALRATLDIAEMVETKLEFDLDLLPKFPVPEGMTESTQLRSMVQAGAGRRYGNPIPAEIQDRIDYELDVIENMGFPAYFLIVADLCEYARRVGIRVGPGRGSAGGSVVAYCTEITQVDPIRHGLIFERFLNPSRNEMPDIDMDFDDRRRGEMIRYAADRYGDDHVAQIITFGTIKAKSAMRDAARVLDEPFAVGDNLAKMMPPAVQGKDWPLVSKRGGTTAYDLSTELRDAREDPTYRKVLETAEKLEGLKRQHGIHAAAVIIGASPLSEVVPLLRTDKGETVTQYEMKACESLGLLKMDFLGLRNLTVLSDAERHVKNNRGVEVNLDDQELLAEMDDPVVYEMLSTGDTLGVFQLDSTGMQALVRKLKPTRFEDISALLALYRPGPLSMDMHHTYADRKNGLEDVSFDHADLEPILGDTFGVVVYQEQVMKIATDLAGFSMADADGLRKAVGKKKRELMESFREQFVDGGVAKDYTAAFMKAQWDLIEKFAEYGFNKAHTVAYGVISYQTAWLKAHYPPEYMAALLTSVKNNKDMKPIYLGECRRMGIDVLPPDVNHSERDFAPVGEDIRFGMSAVRGVGDAVVDLIVEARREHGTFADFRDFCDKVDAGVLNKRTLENLAKAGAFASMGHTRKGILGSFELLVDAALATKKAEAAGQDSLFDMFGSDDSDAPSMDDGIEIHSAEFGKQQLLALEREMLGLYVSDHPLFGTERLLEDMTDRKVSELRQAGDGARVKVGGVLTGLEKRFTKNGDTYLRATLEDLTGSVGCVFWQSTYRVAHEILEEDAVLVVDGRVEVRDEAVNLTVDKVSAPDLTEVRGTPLLLRFGPGQCTAPAVERLRTILSHHRGYVPVHVHVAGADEDDARLALPDEFRVARASGLYGELKAAFGPESVVEPTGVRTFGEERQQPSWARGS